MDVRIDTSQIKILQDFFNDLSKMNQQKIFMASYRRASKPLLDAMRSNLSQTFKTGDLYRSLKAVNMPENVSVIVGSDTSTPHLIRSGKKTKMSKVWYGWLIEKGSYKTGERHWRRATKGKSKGTRSTGRLSASNFVKDAWDSTADEVLGSIQDAWFTEVNNLITRTNNRMK
jgi:hypothetical protein